MKCRCLGKTCGLALVSREGTLAAAAFCCGGGVLRFRDLFGFFDPAGFEGGPVDFLEIEIVQAVDFFGIGRRERLGIELRRWRSTLERVARRSRTVSLRVAPTDEIGGDGEVIEIPLSDTFAALVAVKRNFQEGGVALRRVPR